MKRLLQTGESRSGEAVAMAPDQASTSRRAVVGAGLAAASLASALPLAAWAQADAGASATQENLPAPDPKRLALLIGNRDYPSPFDLPPIHKNVRDLGGALQRRGFSVKEVFDASLGDAKAEVDAFAARVRAAPADAVVLFYYSGHGAQVDARNLLLSAKSRPDAPSVEVRQNSLVLLQDVIDRLPSRPDGLTIAVLDACRTGTSGTGGLNQVVSPPGCMIVFSTGAGKPALAPAVETVNTFFTGSLVKRLDSESDEMSFSRLFQFVGIDVFETMTNHPIRAIRSFAQEPFIADNTRVKVSLAPTRPPAPTAAPGSREAIPTPPKPVASTAVEEHEVWQKIETLRWPADIAKQAATFLEHYPKSSLASDAKVLAIGASKAVKVLKQPEIALYRSTFIDAEAHSKSYQEDLIKAAQGDKDAAARIAAEWKTSATTGAQVSRYEGWLKFAAELGNGIASYDLALHFRANEQPVAADRWEAKAIALGYNPPVSLDNVRK
jgi:hypothetical protein